MWPPKAIYPALIIIGHSQLDKWVLSYPENMNKLCTFSLWSFANNELLCEIKVPISGHHLLIADR